MKYTLVNKQSNGLWQIQALRDIPRHCVKAGDVGGYIEKESNLSQYGDAWVSGNACVSGDARVSGSACVSDNALVSGNAWVCGNARVYGNARVSGSACVSDNARVSGNACVSDNALVSGNAWVYGNAWVSSSARVSGSARVYGRARVSGNAWVSGDAWVGGEAGCVWLPYLRYGVTITQGHVSIGCQQYTFQEFYGLQVDDLVAEGFTEEDYVNTMKVIIPIMEVISKQVF